MDVRGGVTLALYLLIGCGGGGRAKNDGAAVLAGVGGRGGSGGAGGGGAGAGDAGGGSSGAGGSLPACAIVTQPPDPTNDDGGVNTQGMVCNSLTPAGSWIVPEVFTWGDGGAQVDGGSAQAPVGGAILNGDYELVRLQVPSGPGQTTRRSIRVFDGGRYIEWAVAIQNPSADGGVQEIWYDTMAAPSGHDLGAVTVCNAVLSLEGYTADGGDLTFFVYLQSMNDPPIGIDTYRRTCAR